MIQNAVQLAIFTKQDNIWNSSITIDALVKKNLEPIAEEWGLDLSRVLRAGEIILNDNMPEVFRYRLTE